MYYFYEGRTIRGVGLVGWALVVLVSAVVVLAATTALIGVLYGALLLNGVTFLGTLAGVIAAICLAFVGEVAAAVLFLVGFYQIYAGRYEYGLEQSHSLERALIFLIVYVVFSAVSLAFSPTFSIFLGVTGALTVPALAASLVLNPVTALFAGLSLEHSLRTLASPWVRSRLRTALSLGVVGSALGPALTLFAIAGTPVTVEAFSAGIVAAAVAGQGLSAISLVLFWLAYREAQRSLVAGTPPPVLPRAEQIYPWLYGPWTVVPSSPPGPPPAQPPKT